MQRVDDALDRVTLGEIAHLGAPFLGHRANRGFDEIAHHRLDVTADVADLGVLGRFDFDEGRADEGGQPARDLGLTDAGRVRSSECSSA